MSTTGTAGSISRMRRKASRPSMRGMVRSISTRAISPGRRWKRATASSPSEASTTWKPRWVRHARATARALGLVVHHQQGAAPRQGAGPVGRSSAPPGPPAGRNTFMEVPSPGFAVDLEPAAVAADDPQQGGQAQAPAGELGGEERIEDPWRSPRGSCRSRCRSPPGSRSARGCSPTGSEVTGE